MSNRSGTHYSAPTDSNRRPTLLGASTADGITPVALEANPSTGALLVETVSGGGANVNLVQVGGTNIALGQTTMSASLPVAVASDNNLAKETGGNLATIVTNQTNATQQSKITDATNIANVLAPGTANSTGNALLTAGTLSNTVSWTTTSAQPVAATEVGNYKAAYIQVTSQGTNAVHTVQGSNDNSTWNNIGGSSQASGGTFVNTCSSTGIYIFPVNYRYFRVNVTGISALTSAGTVIFSTQYAPVVEGAAQSGTWTVGSNSATGSAVPANAFLVGDRAATSLPSAVSNGQLVGQMADKFGRAVVLPNAMRDLVLPITQLTLTSTTSETTLIGQVASTFNDILSLVVINTSATATQVDFRDSTGGTVRLSLYIPAGDTRGISLTTPLPQNAVNNNWTAKCGSSVASVIITGTYVANQ